MYVEIPTSAPEAFKALPTNIQKRVALAWENLTGPGQGQEQALVEEMGELISKKDMCEIADWWFQTTPRMGLGPLTSLDPEARTAIVVLMLAQGGEGRWTDLTQSMIRNLAPGIDVDKLQCWWHRTRAKANSEEARLQMQKLVLEARSWKEEYEELKEREGDMRLNLGNPKDSFLFLSREKKRGLLE